MSTQTTRQTRGQVFQQILELGESDMEATFQDIDKCKRLCELLHNAILSNSNNRPWLRQICILFKFALKEMNQVEAPSRKEENWGKPGEEPTLSESSEFLVKSLMQQMTENLNYTRPDKRSEFATNYFFRLMLQICKRCIELDISCFRTIEIVFGFTNKDPHRPRFYDSCGLPRYGGNRPMWVPTQYGNGEMDIFERIEQLQKAIKKEEAAIETYDKEIDRLRTAYLDKNKKKGSKNNDNNNNNNNNNNEEKDDKGKAEANDDDDTSNMQYVMNNNGTPGGPNDDGFEIPKEIIVAKQKIGELLENYRGELNIIKESTPDIWEIESWTDYPSDNSKFCGGDESARRKSWFTIQNINYFGRIGGFDATIQRIGHALCPVPTSDLVNLIRPPAQLRDLLNRQFFEEYVGRLIESLRRYFHDMPDIVMRDFPRQSADKVLRNLQYMMNSRFQTMQINEAKEKLKLAIASRQFRSPFATARIRGVQEINAWIQKVIDKDELLNKPRSGGGMFGGFQQNNKRDQQREEMLRNTWMTSEYLLHWLEEEKVLEFMLNRQTTHVELVRRIDVIFQLLDHLNALDIEKHLDPLWQLTLHGQHESIKHLVYEHVSKFAENMTLEQLKHLFQQIAKTPPQDYDSQMLQLIKKFTNHAFVKQSKESSDDAKPQWFGLDLLWKFVQTSDTAKQTKSGKKRKLRRLVSEKVAREALSLFLELLSTEYAISQREMYMEKCIWHVQESNKVVQNLILLQRLIQTFPITHKTWYSTQTTAHQNTQAGVIERLEKDYAIVDHLLQDLAFYKGTAMSVVQTMRSEKDKDDKIVIQTLRVDDSSYNYLEQIKIRLDFLLFLLTHSTLRLTRQQYRRIWDHLVGGAMCREEMDLCYLWILRGSIPPTYSSPSDSHYKLYNQQDQRFLFEHCIRRLPAAHLSESAYLLVTSFFCSVNKRAASLSIIGEKKKLPKHYMDDSKRNGDSNDNTRSAQSSSSSSPSKPRTNDGSGAANDEQSDHPSPTQGTTVRLAKYISNQDSDLLNDGTYLIDPDNHYVDPKKLRIIDYNALEGKNYFWDVVLKARLPQVGEDAIQLLNALHFYFAQRLKQKEQDDIRVLHVQKCLQWLERGLAGDPNKDENRIIVKRMIMLLKQFLESFLQGEYDKTNYVDLEIVPDKEFRVQKYTIQCKLTETFGSLRNKIYQRLSKLNTGLQINHLIIHWNIKYTIQPQHDKNRLSQLDWNECKELVISRVRYAFTREFWKCPQRQQIADAYQYPIQSSYPTAPKRALLSGFKRVEALQVFAQDQKAFDQLFPLLKQPTIGPAVWDILNLLPPSQQKVQRVLELGFQNPENSKRLQQIFDMSNPYQLLYHLQILSAILTGDEWRKENFQGNRFRNRTNVTHKGWVETFIKMGGFDFICNLLFQSDMTKEDRNRININNEEDETDDDISRSIRVSCESFLFQIISLLLQMDRLFLHVIPPATYSVADGAITNLQNFDELQEKLIQRSLEVSQRILVLANAAIQHHGSQIDEQMGIQGPPSKAPKDESEKKESKSNDNDDDDNVTTSLDIQNLKEKFKKLTVTRAVSSIEVSQTDDLGPSGANILMESFLILVSCIRTTPDYVDTLFKMEDLTSWLSGLLFNAHYPSTRASVSKALQYLSRVQFKDEKDNLQRVPVSVQLLNELVKILSSSEAQQRHCFEFFDLLLHVFDHVCRTYKDTDKAIRTQILNIAYEAFEQLQMYKSREVYEKPELTDDFLIGVINLLRIAIQHKLFSESKANLAMSSYAEKVDRKKANDGNSMMLTQGYTPGGPMSDLDDNNDDNGVLTDEKDNGPKKDYENIVGDLVMYIFNDCLFNVPQRGDSGAKCKAAMSRQWAYGLIQCIADTYSNSLPLIQSLILKDPVWYHVNRQDLNKVSWSYHPSDLERFPVKYCGLKNQGATCYMNSLMQQLFIVDGFRHALLEARVTDPNRSAAITRGGDTAGGGMGNMGNMGNMDEQKGDNMHDDDAMMDSNSDAVNTDNEIVKAGLLPKDRVLYQMQLLFGYLLKSQKKFYDTMPLCKVFRGIDGEPLQLGVQQDVNEFCNRLFDQLENDLKETQHKECINGTFGGYLVNQMISKEAQCGHTSERDEPFHTVAIQMKNKENLQEALDLYVGGEMLDGDNKYLCSQCNNKVAALKRVCFKKLPKYLMLNLARFEFDFNTMRRKKLNTRFEFPLTLNMEKYTKEGLEKQALDSDEATENKNDANNDNDAANQSQSVVTSITSIDENGDDDGGIVGIGGPPSPKNNHLARPKLDAKRKSVALHPPEYYDYELTGVIMHTGGAESGHYYSYAKSKQDGKWWEFNDVDILPFDINDLDEECFGGLHTVTVDDPQRRGVKVEKEVPKPYNAYMLIYKQKMAAMAEDRNEQFIEKIQNEKHIELPLPIQNTIWQENLKFLTDKNVFDFDYLTFLWNLVTTQSASKNFMSISSNSDLSEKKDDADLLAIDSGDSNNNNNKKKENSVGDGYAVTGGKFEMKDDLDQDNEFNNEYGDMKITTTDDEIILLRNVQIATLFTFEVLVRSKDNGTYPKWMAELYKMYYRSELARKWFLHKVATQEQWFINCGFHNVHRPARQAFMDLILACIQYQKVSDAKYYDDFLENITHYRNWSHSDNKNMTIQQEGTLLKEDKFVLPRFIMEMVSFLSISKKYHKAYTEYFLLLKGIALVGFTERKLLIKLGAIRAIVGFYMNDQFTLHFNRQVSGRNQQGQRQHRRIHPPRVLDVIKLLSILVRSGSTSQWPPVKPKSDNNNSNNNKNDKIATPINTNDNQTSGKLEAEPDNYDGDAIMGSNNGSDADSPSDGDRLVTGGGGPGGADEEKELHDLEASMNGNNSNEYTPNELNDLGYPKGCILNDDNLPQPIRIDDEDMYAIFNGFYPKVKSLDECPFWHVPPLVDRLPSSEEYQRYQQEMQQLNDFRKQNPNYNGQLPRHLQEIAQKKPLTERPRLLYPMNILEWMLRDRNAAFNQILYADQVCEILTYFGHNDWEFSNHVFTWAYRKIADEFKSSFEYGPYLRIITSLMSDVNDRHYAEKCKVWLPQMATLARRCSGTNEQGTDLLMYSIISWFANNAMKYDKFQQFLNEDNGFLNEVMTSYEKNHVRTYDAVSSGWQRSANNRKSHTSGAMSAVGNILPSNFSMGALGTNAQAKLKGIGNALNKNKNGQVNINASSSNNGGNNNNDNGNNNNNNDNNGNGDANSGQNSPRGN